MAVVALATACSSPTGPNAANLAGRWSGTFLVTDCVTTGVHSTCPASSAPGTLLGAALMFTEADGASVEGYGAYGAMTRDLLLNLRRSHGFFHRFQTQLQPDGTMKFASTAGAPPTAVEELSWEITLVSAARLEGALRARSAFYKVPGDTVMTGTVILQRQ